MNVSQLSSTMSNSESSISQNIASNTTIADLTNPNVLLKQQAWVMEYTTAVGFQSAMIKTVKDMLSGIISKI